MKLTSRWYAFLTAADETGPTWEIYARRIGMPLALGIALGLVLFVIVSALPASLGAVLVVVLALAGVVWSLLTLRSLKRDTRRLEELLREDDELLRLAKEKDD